METNARYLYIGGFVLGSFILGVLFILWIAKDSVTSHAKPYLINFQESVVGLKTGAQVLYRGVPVGMVRSIDLNPQNQALVRVKVEINPEVLITEGTEASLKSQGLTGLTYIEVVGGGPGHSPLKKHKGDPFPVIPSVPSQIESIMQSAPDLVSALEELARGTSQLVNKQNRDHVASILKQVDGVTKKLMENADRFPVIITNTQKTLKSIDDTASAYHQFIDKLDRDLLPLIHKVREIFEKNEDGFKVLLSSGLYEFTKMLSEMRKTLSSVNRLASQIERDPQSFLFGDSEEGYALK